MRDLLTVAAVAGGTTLLVVVGLLFLIFGIPACDRVFCETYPWESTPTRNCEELLKDIERLEGAFEVEQR